MKKAKVRPIDANALLKELKDKKVIYYSVQGFKELVDKQPTIVLKKEKP